MFNQSEMLRVLTVDVPTLVRLSRSSGIKGHEVMFEVYGKLNSNLFSAALFFLTVCG